MLVRHGDLLAAEIAPLIRPRQPWGEQTLDEREGRTAHTRTISTSLVRAMAGNTHFPPITGWVNSRAMCWASVLLAPLPNAMSLPPAPNLAAMSAAVAVTASAHSTRARPASRRRAKASATALEATDPDRAPSMPFTDAPPAHASEKTTSATPRGGDRVARRAKQKECLMLARRRRRVLPLLCTLRRSVQPHGLVPNDRGIST